VRGSVGVSGPSYVEFGGQTPCVEIRCGERLFIVDGGTGLASLGVDLDGRAPKDIDLLFSHLHLDHVGGLPFFEPALKGGHTIHTWCGNLGGATAKEPLERLYAPPLFPVGLSQFPSRFEHHGFRAGETLTFSDGVTVRTHALPHPQGATGYRFDHAGRAVCYISDIEHTDDWPPADLVAFVRGANLVIYDGMFSEAEYRSCHGWGHSTWQKGVALCQAAGAGLAIFHLSPMADDAKVRAAEADLKAVMPEAFVARQGQSVDYPPVC
jgi:phosphoribosyl 1,2-cyclic phosphodiesterase